MQKILSQFNRPKSHLHAIRALNNAFKSTIRDIHQTRNLLEQIRLKMPAFSPTMTEGTIVKWHKKEGDSISPGETLFEVQTDKAVLAFDTEEEGVLAKIIKGDAQTIPVGTLVGVIVTQGEDWKSIKIDEALVGPETTKNESQKNEKNSIMQHDPIRRQVNILGPVAKSLISLYEIDITKISGSGPHGLVLKSLKSNRDRIKQDHKPPSTKDSPKSVEKESIIATYTDIELSNMRKVIAKRLTLSKTTIPHTYLDAVCVLDNVIEMRQELIKIYGLKISLNDCIIKALGLALRIVPEMNSLYEQTSESEVRFKQPNSVDVSVAVATDKGLITPIIKNADKLNVQQISKTLKSLAEKARAGKLQPHEFQGGTFSISNLGMFGIKEFSAVINPPQTGILAVGASRKIISSVNDASLASIQNVCNVKLSFDERAIEIDRAIHFLESLKFFLKNPDLLVYKTPDPV